MTPDMRTLEIITSWVTRLVDVTAHSDGKPGKVAIAAYAAILGQTFPSAAFTIESLAAVTECREWFPAVSVAGKVLDKWWQDHKPQGAPALTDGRARPAGWADADQRWVDFWFRRRPEIADIGDRREQEIRMGILESLIRCQSPRAAQWLGMYRDNDGFEHSRPNDAEIERVAVMLAAWKERMAAASEKPRRKAAGVASLGSDALRAIRAANGLHTREMVSP